MCFEFSVRCLGGDNKTQDYKKLLCKYITGDIQPTAQSKEEILNEISSVPRSEFSGFIPESYTAFLPMNIIQSSTNGNFILYGGYVPTGETASSDSRGFIMILDQNMKPIKTIYEFSTGTKLLPIQKMIQIEDGTFVAIDSTIYAQPIATTDIMTNPKRFIMLNNFSTPDYNNDYSVILRKSYNLPNAYKNIFAIDIVKNPNSSHYLIAGKTLYNNGGTYYDGVRIIDLKINVGSSNEWSQKASSSNAYFLYGGFHGEFDEDDNASYKAIITKNASPIVLYSWDGTTLTELLSQDGDIKPYVDSVAMRNQVSFIDYDNVYFVINNQRWGSTTMPRYIGLYKYTYSTGNIKEIYLKSLGNFDNSSSKEGIFIQALEGELYVNYCDNYNYNNKTANFNFQRLENDCWDPILVSEDQKYQMEYTMNCTFNIYNLVTNILMEQILNETYFNIQIIKEVYNNLNYNSTSYDNYNSLVPHSSVLYDNNDKIIFARNLYNATSFRNTTTSTLEVPNSMLNNASIKNKNLFSLTNTLLNTDNNTISKNIYETLYINFVDIINVVDNDTGNVYLSTGANITTNINSINSDNTTMNNKKISKLKINYQDGTDKVVGLHVRRYSNTWYHIRSTIYVDKETSTVDLISNDETQTYITIDVSNLEVGNYYTLEQDLNVR